jgi:hypothetical protein
MVNGMSLLKELNIFIAPMNWFLQTPLQGEK